MDIFWYPWPKELYCDSFPDVDDPNICLGYKTAHEPPTIEGNLATIPLDLEKSKRLNILSIMINSNFSFSYYLLHQMLL
jgi:hypothetical protein